MAKAKKEKMTTSKKMWYKIKHPTPWAGQRGEELIGKYTVSVRKPGRFGEYFQHCIMAEDKTYFVTGTIADSLFAHVPPGEIVKLKCLGQAQHQDGFTKLYEPFTERPISAKLDDEIGEEPTNPVEYTTPEVTNDPPY